MDPAAHAIVLAAERRFGLALHEGIRRSVAQAAVALVTKRLAGSLAEVSARIATAPAEDEVVHALLRATSIGETMLFRTPEQLFALVDVLRKSRFGGSTAKKGDRVRAWSAGCATGEEAYTLAILLMAAFPLAEVEVLGTDMNATSLAHAREGVYRGRALRQLHLVPAGQWFERHEDGIRISDPVRAAVRFETHNLVNDPIPAPAIGLGAFDVVVCRNVLIYIDAQKLPKVVQGLAAATAERGVLALAPSEYLAAQHATGFSDTGRALLLRGGQRAGAVARPPSKPSVIAVSPPAAPAKAPVSRSTAKITAPSGTPALIAPPADAPIPTLLGSARQFADQGALEQATLWVQRAVAAAPDDPHPRYLAACIAERQGDHARAAEEFRRALFLAPELVAAALGAARAQEQLGRAEDAVRLRRRALTALERLPPDASVAELELSVGAAANLVRQLLADDAEQGETP